MSAATRVVRLGCIENGTAIWGYDTSTGDANFDGMGLDIIQVTLERSGRSILGPNSVQSNTYRNLKMVFIQNATGGYSITLASKFVKPDGTTWGLLPTGAANLRAVLEFTYTGTKYVSAQSSLVYA
jgi:hypothetical protein